MKIEFNETRLIVYIFKIPIFKKNIDKIYDLIINMMKNTEASKINISNILKYIYFDKVKIILNTIINNYQNFIIEKYLIYRIDCLLRKQNQIPIENSNISIYEDEANHFEINIDLHFKLINIIRGIYEQRN